MKTPGKKKEGAYRWAYSDLGLYTLSCNPVGATDFYSVQNIQTGSGAQIASC